MKSLLVKLLSFAFIALLIILINIFKIKPTVAQEIIDMKDYYQLRQGNYWEFVGCNYLADPDCQIGPFAPSPIKTKIEIIEKLDNFCGEPGVFVWRVAKNDPKAYWEPSPPSGVEYNHQWYVVDFQTKSSWETGGFSGEFLTAMGGPRYAIDFQSSNPDFTQWTNWSQWLFAGRIYQKDNKPPFLLSPRYLDPLSSPTFGGPNFHLRARKNPGEDFCPFKEYPQKETKWEVNLKYLPDFEAGIYQGPVVRLRYFEINYSVDSHLREDWYLGKNVGLVRVEQKHCGSHWGINHNLPGGLGPYDAYGAFVDENRTLYQSFYKGNEGWNRKVPLEADGTPDWGNISVWNSFEDLSLVLPGPGPYDAYGAFIDGNRTLHQSFYKGNVGWNRKVPLKADGTPDWGNASEWTEFSDLGAVLPGGPGPYDAYGAFVDGSQTLHQTFYKDNLGWNRKVPLKADGTPDWGNASEWTEYGLGDQDCWEENPTEMMTEPQFRMDLFNYFGTLVFQEGWNEVLWPEVAGIKASDIPDVCSIAVSQENSWFKPYVRNYGGGDFGFENGKAYWLKCNQSTTWNL